MRIQPLAIALAVCLTGVCCRDGSSSSSSTSGAELENLGLAFDRVRHGGERVAFTVHETGQGGDYNGDGDSTDRVLHLTDLASRTTVNLRLAVSDFRIEAGFLVFLVTELQQGAGDLNGDGDTSDAVLHVHDVTAGTTNNLGLAAPTGFELEQGVVAFQVSEQGQGVDLNADGDTLDRVLHVLELASGITTNLGFAVTGLAHLDAGAVAFAVSEAGQGGTDLNADGDMLDHVIHVHDPAAGTTNLGLAASVLFLAGAFADFEFQNGIVAISVREPDQDATDLNGDGDIADNVLHVHDTSTGTTRNLGLPIRDNVYTIGEGFVAVPVREAEHAATDLNLDGDIGDSVLQIHAPATGVTTNTRLAVLEFTVDHQLVMAGVLEQDQGQTDLTGDGDALDTALILYDVATGLVQNPLAPGERPHRIGPDLLAFEVHEIHTGDLDGDGNVLDRILHLYDLPGQITTNLGVNGRILDADARHLVYVAFEELLDLNGDGDALDPVLHVLDTHLGLTHNARLAGKSTDGAGIPLGFRDGVLAFAADEFLQGQTDLNDDGDAFDPEVLYLVELPR